MLTPFRFLSRYRGGLAAVLAVCAMALFIAAAADFDPILRQAFLRQGVEKMLIGAAALAAALLLSPRRPPLQQPIRQPLSRPKSRFWLLPFGAGAVMLLLIAAWGGGYLRVEPFAALHIHVQFALLAGGALLVMIGLGGAPRLRWGALRLPREDRLTAAAVVGILILALIVRLWDHEGALRVLIDELHWVDGLQRVRDTPTINLLYQMSGTSPYTQIFPYWQTAAVELIGYSWTGLRFVSVICGTLTVLAAYGLGRALFDRTTALVGMLILAGLPPHVHFSRIALLSIADPLFGTMAIMFVARALRRNHRMEWAAAGISLGFSQYFYDGGRLLFPALLAGWLGALAIGGHLRGRWRGAAILIIAFALVALPVYTTIIGNDLQLFGRMDVSGDEGLARDLSDGLSLGDLLMRAQRALSAFMLFGAHQDMSAYYGGQQALVNTVVVPAFLFGAFLLLLRFPAPAFVVALWIIAAGAANGLLRDTLVSARHYVTLPAIALAIAAGVRFFPALLAGIVPEFDAAGVRHRFWRWATAAAWVLGGAVFVYHVGYYFGPHLAYFNEQVRDSKPYRDGVDAAQRAAALPGNTQVYLIGFPEHDQHVPRHFLTFLAQDRGGSPDRFFPLLSVPTAAVSPRFLRDLPPGVNYAFFIEPHADETIRAIYRQFPRADAPAYTLTDMPARKAYVLIWAPVGSGR